MLPGVRWLWDIFRRGAREPKPGVPVCFLRENGPIAYQLTLFPPGARDRADAILGSDLSWYWRSSAREWTALSRWSLGALLEDVASPQADVLIVGIASADAPAHTEDAVVASWMKAFAADAPGPLHVVIHHRSGVPALVFVAQHPLETVRALLHAWSIDRDRAERRAYARLGDASLEAVARRLAAQR